ncbi:hypothetical protein WMY93_001277 [Mugilogobius chulae]|uniref:ATP-dependent RNA helicase DHX30 n=1 Tax=Mugilogobius chulae TaxID=88201 RepID=A0AAW0Q1U7_9GOBI
MALPRVLLVQMRAFCTLGKCVQTRAQTAANWSREMRWYRTKARSQQDHGTDHEQGKRGNLNSSLLKNFPDSKGLLHDTISRSLGIGDISRHVQYSYSENAGVKKVKVTVLWPCKIEEEGYASKKLDAERMAAAAVCQKLKDMGVIGPNNQLPQRRAGRGRGRLQSHFNEEDFCEKNFIPVSLFPQPKSLLTRVIQVATSSSRIRELVQYKTTGGKVKTCELTMHWPEEIKFTATANNRASAEKRAAALACLKLKELELLDENNDPLTHAKYHRELVKEVGARERRPFLLDVPEYLQDSIKSYLIEWESTDTDFTVELPVDAHRERVLSAVQSSRVVVIAGETGCGKTTRIPRFLLEERTRGGEGANCNILVTQPRRISAVSVAHRVAQEMDPALKRSVGYQVRLESRPPEHSGGALLFLTVGVLLKKLQSNPSLKGISHVVVDEVHERDINTDLLLALLRTGLQENPDLRVVLMSATGDNQRLSQYFGRCPIVKVPGFMHPVRDRFLEDVLKEMGRPLPRQDNEESAEMKKDETTLDLDLVVDVIEHVDRRGEPGAILCFLPGWQDIKMVQEKLAVKPHFSFGKQMVLPLHSSLSVADQQTVFKHPPPGQRKIVLTTNIAETSITIDDIVHVVDAGMHKEQNYDPRTKVSCLDTVWISRSNVTQRKGRAGRCQPGHSYHLFSQKQLKSMTPFPIPEILRTPLENLVLQAKIHSPRTQAIDFLAQVLDSPNKGAVKDAVQNLQDIGVLDKTEALTPLGERVAYMSCDPRLGKMLILGALFRCVLPLLSVAACLTRDPFHNSLQNRALIIKAKDSLSQSNYSDYLVLNQVVLGWRRLQKEGDREERDEYLDKYMLSRTSLRYINGMSQLLQFILSRTKYLSYCMCCRSISQFSDNLDEAEVVSRANECQRLDSLYNEHSAEDELLKAVLLAGMYPNLIQVKRGFVTKSGRFRPNTLAFKTKTGPVILHRSTVNRGKEDLPVAGSHSSVRSSPMVRFSFEILQKCTRWPYCCSRTVTSMKE